MTLNQVREAVQRITGKRAERVASYTGAVALVRSPKGKYVSVESQSEPGTFHTVTAHGGCDCKGYGYRGTCVHYDVAMTAIAKRAEAGATAPAASADDYAAWCREMGEAEQAQMRPVSAKRQPSGDLHITDAETGRVVGIITSVQDDIDAIYGPAA